ncbi:MAG: hypothetical protein KIS95_01490 [Anaerolineae bacterium]|uniref:hypothetical protein n=1 Tax=Promineifilum sp. TaxID=2664178 RepID=UPI001D53EB66|nr:hypothetical protein [Anaerolineales bacterium]MCB8934010.1 hypothetical protein [Promineifilum sp.]MCO5179409.1 hypothetical protein [Promineifilum sp.]MCW5845875.1 hypothetical protein [Anaerolineae bacterium]
MFIPSRSPEPDDELARSIVVAEYGYIAQTAFQANEDRARAWQYFFVTFATLIAALLSTQLEADLDGLKDIYLTFVVIFSLLAVLGLITTVQLVRLRQAWLESARAMNQIKERLIADDPSLAAYFRWRNETLPAAFKWRSFGFLQAVSVALLSGLAVGAAVAFAGLSEGVADVPWQYSLPAAGLAAAGILWLGYVRPLQATTITPGPDARPRTSHE